MEIITKKTGAKAEISLKGRMDTPAAGEFSEALEQAWNDGCRELDIDLQEMNYICSAGLRSFLKMQKRINSEGNGSMVLRNVSSIIEEVFEMTGFSGILTILK